MMASSGDRLPRSESAAPPRRSGYTPAVTPRLRRVLILVLVLVALTGANSLYLVTVTALENLRGQVLQNYFYQYMFLGHLILGLLLIVPFLVFAVVHLANTRHRKNRRAVRMGYALFTAGLILLLTGLLLTRRPAGDPLARTASSVLLDPRHRPAGDHLAVLAASAGRPADPLAPGAGLPGRGGCRQLSHGRPPYVRSAPVVPGRLGGRSEVFRAFAGANQHGQVPLATGPDERPVLCPLPCGHSRRLGRECPPVQFI